MKPRLFIATVIAGITTLILWEWVRPRVQRAKQSAEQYHPLVRPEVNPAPAEADEPWWKF